MITKERLEELIEQGATIYSTHWGEEIDLSQKCEVIKKKFYDGKVRLVLIVHEDDEHSPHYLLQNLTEDIEGAKWQEEFGNITRTERLELPTWQQIENIIEQKKKFGLNHSDRVLARIITNDSIYYFKLCKDLDLFTFELKQTYIGEDLCEQLTSRFPVSLGKATKENYTLACRKAKELFLGEKDE